MKDFKVPEGWKIKSQTDGEVTFVKKKGLPRRWEDLNKLRGEYIDTISKITQISVKNEIDDGDRNIIPESVGGNAVLHLIMLLQLRDKYNDGWVPNWKNESQKWCIYHSRDNLLIVDFTLLQRTMAFKTKELAEQFLSNFRDYLEIAKPLL